MPFSELQNKTEHELQELLKQAQIRLGQLRFQLAESKLTDFSQLKKTRREIARLLTALQHHSLRAN